MTKEQMFENLETNTLMTPLHFAINKMGSNFRLFAHDRARDSFPNGVPIMDGSSKCGAGPAVEEEEKNIISEAKKPPLQMIIQSPDPHGTVSYRITFD